MHLRDVSQTKWISRHTKLGPIVIESLIDNFLASGVPIKVSLKNAGMCYDALVVSVGIDDRYGRSALWVVVT